MLNETVIMSQADMASNSTNH